MERAEFEELQIRLCRLEDTAEITRLIMSTGRRPSRTDLVRGAAMVRKWAYDWDAEGMAHQGSAGVEAMLKSDGHLSLMARGIAHFGGPPLIDLDGDEATAVNYSLIMRSEGDRFYLWRVSAVRWDLERVDSRMASAEAQQSATRRDRRRSRIFGDTLTELFDEAAR